jgi:hypothetical protein
VAILKFIQPIVLSPLLKPMDQSKPGGTQVMEAKVHLRTVVTPKFLQLMEPLSPLKLTVQSQLGAGVGLTALKMRPCPETVAILIFIQINFLLPPLKPMDQSQLGGIQIMEAKVHPIN